MVGVVRHFGDFVSRIFDYFGSTKVYRWVLRLWLSFIRLCKLINCPPGCSLLTWKSGLPVTELNMQLIFCALTLLFLPLFLASALFKIGNLANDGVKLSSRKGTCTSDPPIFEDDGNNSTMKSLWTHGVPISVFIHIITALCLLLPHLLLEAKLIQSQHLPKGKDNTFGPLALDALNCLRFFL